MPERGRRRLVIDADVARSAGETEHPVSSACGKFLSTTTELGHRVVVTGEIRREWRKHASRYTRRWLVGMYGGRLVWGSTVDCDDQLRRRVACELPGLQDIHLVEAAIATACCPYGLTTQYSR